MTGLEVVLKHAQDWEQHASVRVRLGEPLFDVRRVVSSWRKLELQSWPWLLQSREESFKMNGRKHWIRIHQIVRKFIVISNEEAQPVYKVGTPRWVWHALSKDVDRMTYLFNNKSDEVNSIVKVLDTFCLTAPLGEFHLRLKILYSFSSQLSRVAKTRESAPSLVQLSLASHPSNRQN